MIVDFQHHFTPHALMPKDMGKRKIITYDEHGAPSFIMHWMLFDLDEHIAMMDESGIDVAFLTSAAGMCAPLDKSKLCNEAAKKAERDYPGRFIGAAHANPLGGAGSVPRARPLQARTRISRRGDHVGDQRPLSRRAGVRAVLGRVREARDVRVRPPCPQAQPDHAVRRLRHRALGRPRVLAGDGDDPADQFRRVRSPPQTDDPHVASRRRLVGAARPHPLLPGQGFLGHRRQRAPWRQGEAGVRPLHPQQFRVRYRGLLRRAGRGENAR